MAIVDRGVMSTRARGARALGRRETTREGGKRRGDATRGASASDARASARRRVAASARGRASMRVGRVVTCAGRGDEPGEIGRAMFENGVGTASFRGYKLVDEIVLEL